MNQNLAVAKIQSWDTFAKEITTYFPEYNSPTKLLLLRELMKEKLSFLVLEQLSELNFRETVKVLIINSINRLIQEGKQKSEIVDTVLKELNSIVSNSLQLKNNWKATQGKTQVQNTIDNHFEENLTQIVQFMLDESVENMNRILELEVFDAESVCREMLASVPENINVPVTQLEPIQTETTNQLKQPDFQEIKPEQITGGGLDAAEIAAMEEANRLAIQELNELKAKFLTLTIGSTESKDLAIYLFQRQAINLKEVLERSESEPVAFLVECGLTESQAIETWKNHITPILEEIKPELEETEIKLKKLDSEIKTLDKTEPEPVTDTRNQTESQTDTVADTGNQTDIIPFKQKHCTINKGISKMKIPKNHNGTVVSQNQEGTYNVVYINTSGDEIKLIQHPKQITFIPETDGENG